MNLIIHALLAMTCLLSVLTHTTAATLTATTTYLGNTQSRGANDNPYLQAAVSGIYVAADGRVFTNTNWDEGHREFSCYQDGRFLKYTSNGQSHGGAITGDGSYLYVTSQVNVSGAYRLGVSRYTLEMKTAAGTIGSFLNLSDVSVQNRYVGLTTSATELFVADASSAQIQVYKKDYSSTTLQRSWSVTRPGPMTTDSSGNIWMTQLTDGITAGKVVCYDPVTGTVLKQITDVVDPRGLAINANGQLLVAESGPNQHIRIYNISATPTLASTFGTQYGVFAGTGATIGTPGILRFYDPIGVGVDGAGNIYVATGEVTLQSYTVGGTLRWKMEAYPSLDICQPDPASDNVIFGWREQYDFDYAQRSGNEWSLAGVTLNRFKYPQDPRIFGVLTGWPHTYGVRNIDGHRFFLSSGQNGKPLTIYRFNSATDGTVAIPCAMFACHWAKNSTWPPNLPTYISDYATWYWQDIDGDGQFDTGEFTIVREARENAVFQMDTAGNVWQVNYQWKGSSGDVVFIRRYPLFDILANGVPDWDTPLTYSAPAPFNTSGHYSAMDSIQNLAYDAVNDTMYLAGFTATYTNYLPSAGGAVGFPQSGRVIAKYTTWSSSPQKQWEIVLPNYDSPATNYPKALAFAGDYLFVGYLTTGIIEVFRTSDGVNIGQLESGGQGQTGPWIDSVHGLAAHRRSTGEYFICAETGYGGASLDVLRWTPGTSGPTSPANLTASPSSQRVLLTWTDVTNETGYKLERRDHTSAGWSSWQPLDESIGADVMTHADATITPGMTYAYRLRAYNASGNSDYSVTVYATTYAAPPTLIGRWKLDADLLDSAGTAHGTMYGGTATYHPGQVYQGLNCDGVDDYAKLPLDDNLAANTIAAWVKIDTIRAQCILNNNAGSPTASSWQQLRVNATGQFEHFVFGASPGGVVTSSTVAQTGVWYFIVGVAEPGNVRLYVNGVQEGNTLTIGALNTSANQWRVGGPVSGYIFLDGVVDDVRIYSRVLSNAEITSLYHNYRGIVSRYMFDNTVTDAVRVNHGTFTGGTATYVSGKQSNALQFDGADDYVLVANDASLNPQAITLCCWARSDHANWSSATNFISKRNAFILGPQSTIKRILFYVYAGGAWRSVLYNPPSNFAITDWHHYAGAYDGVTLKIFVDGVFRTSTAYTGTINTADTGNLYLGSDDLAGGYPRYLDGNLDDVRIYNRALSAAEILSVRDMQWE